MVGSRTKAKPRNFSKPISNHQFQGTQHVNEDNKIPCIESVTFLHLLSILCIILLYAVHFDLFLCIHSGNPALIITGVHLSFARVQLQITNNIVDID